MTNDPEYVWHLRNLNNFATMSPFWSNPFGTQNGLGGQIATSEIGAVRITLLTSLLHSNMTLEHNRYPESCHTVSTF